MKSFAMFVAASALFLLPVSAMAEDRAPTADEKAKVEEALKADGFTSWGKIELDDGKKWEVDDAKHSDGKEYDVDLDLNYKILKRDPD